MDFRIRLALCALWDVRVLKKMRMKQAKLRKNELIQIDLTFLSDNERTIYFDLLVTRRVKITKLRVFLTSYDSI
jgi:hypothetical protein